METDRTAVETNVEAETNVGATVDKKDTGSRIGPYVLYTICFAVVFSLIFLFFIKSGKSFIQYGDGYRQGYFWTIEFRNAIDNMLAGNGIDFWNWSAGLGRPSRFGSFFDPFQWLAASFVPDHVEFGYTIAIVAQMYLAGIAFILAAKKFAIDRLALVLGAMTYVFSSWVLNTALIQGNFMQNMILFPLLVLGVEKIYERRSPLLFTLVVAYYTLRMPYFAYMAAIMILIYIFLRYFGKRENKGFGDFIKTMLSFIFYGVVGIMISMIVMISSFFSLSGASTESGSGLEASGLFDEIYYSNIVSSLMSTGPIAANYMYLGVASVIILLLACSLRRFSIRNTPLLMSIVCVIFLMIPFFNSMFNGFSYPTGRWYYMMLFFFMITAMETLCAMDRKRASDRIMMLLTMIAVCGLLYLEYRDFDLDIGDIFGSGASINFFATFVNLGTALIVMLFLMFKKNDSRRIGNNAVTFILIITMIGTVLMWTPTETKKMRSFLRDGEVEYKLSTSVQRVGPEIDDDDFYRLDQVKGISVDRTLSKYANETLRWQTRSIYTYDSKVPSTLLYYNKLLGNNEDYVERVTLFSNDNRAGLDLMTGVKYFLGDDEATGSRCSQYAGYGFEDYKKLSGVSILKNKYSIGLGAGFDSYITQSEFEKLSRLEREQALLQAAVVADDEEGEYSDMEEADSDEIETSVREVPYNLTPGRDAEIRESKIVIRKDGGTVTVHPSRTVKGQMFLSFDGLYKTSGDGLASDPFTIDCKAGDIEKVLMNKLGNQGISDIVDYDVNLDYWDAFNGDITLTFDKAGEYEFSRMYMSEMDMTNYDKYASALQEEKFDISSFGNDTVEGSIEAENDEIVYFSIPADIGWTVYVDGEKAHMINDLNYAFCGVKVPEGKHDIELRYSYPGLETGLLISCAGIALLILALIVRAIARRRAKRKTGSSEAAGPETI